MQTIAVDSIGPELRRIRKAAGMTLKQVSECSGVSVSFLSDLERGVGDPSLMTLRNLSRTYGESFLLTITSHP